MARNPNQRTSSGAITIAPQARVNIRPPLRFLERLRKRARELGSGVWSQVLGKAAGITCGMLALAAIGAFATARGLGGQRMALAEPSTSSSSARERALPAVPAGAPAPRHPGSFGASLGAPAHSPLDGPGHGASPAASGSASPGTPAAPSEGLTADGKVILNRANLEDLRRLPGVGPKRAQAILDLRAKLGRFRKPTDLLRVKGIGAKSLKKLEPHFVLDPPAVPAT